MAKAREDALAGVMRGRFGDDALEKGLRTPKQTATQNEAAMRRWNGLYVKYGLVSEDQAAKAKGPFKGGQSDIKSKIRAEYGNSECFVRSQPLLLRNKRKVEKDHQMDTIGNTIGRPCQVIRQGYLKEVATVKQMFYKNMISSRLQTGME